MQVILWVPGLGIAMHIALYRVSLISLLQKDVEIVIWQNDFGPAVALKLGMCHIFDS